MTKIVKYRCLIVDDEKLGRELIASYVAQFPYLEVAGECSSAIEALQLVAKNDYDVLFLDINMPHISGIDLLKQTPKLPPVVLCTAYSEYALESYEFDVVDYLLKPIDFARFSKSITRLMDRLQVKIAAPIAQASQAAYFFVKSDYKKIKIVIPEIRYIEAMEKYVRIHTENERVMSLMSMSKILAELPERQFLRIHRSYIVNTNKIEMLEGNMVIIGDAKIPISKANRKLVHDLLGTA